MIARIGYFGGLTPEQDAASTTNLRERFKPAITSQDGFVAAYWLRGADGRVISFSIWESEDKLREGGTRANAAPLLPGQNGDLIPSPERMEICEVVDHS
jgi:heme-degrading monooxygenase HmoA